MDAITQENIGDKDGSRADGAVASLKPAIREEKDAALDLIPGEIRGHVGQFKGHRNIIITLESKRNGALRSKWT